MNKLADNCVTLEIVINHKETVLVVKLLHAHCIRESQLCTTVITLATYAGSVPPPPFIKDDLDMMGCGVRYIKPSCREGGGGVVRAALERRTQPLTCWAESGPRIAGVMVPLSPFETGQDAEDSGKAVNHRSATARSRWFQVRPGDRAI